MKSKKGEKSSGGIMKSKAVRIVCAAALAFAMVPASALAAWADDDAAQTAEAARIAQPDEGCATYTDAFDSLGGSNVSDEATLAEALPSKVDLRERGYVPGVRFQNPWGSCWAFSIIAAAEVSVLGELGKQVSEYALDLSEHHLSWFAKNHLAAEGEEGYDPVDVQYQSGEGVWSKTGQRQNDSMSSGFPFYATSTFGAGMGAVEENANSAFLYRGAAGKVLAYNQFGESATFDSYDAAVAAGYSPWCYSSDDDWTISESLRFYQSYGLEESCILPNITKKNAQDEWEYNGDIATGQNEGVNAIKKQISENRGVSIGYKSDAGYSQETSRYINTTNWAHYTWEFGASANHAVAVVGYDDNYAKENFTITPAKWDSSGNAIYKLTDTGAVLPNDSAQGNKPYLTDIEGNKVYFETTSEYIEEISAGSGTYQIKSDYRELANDANGQSLIPGTTDKVLGNKSTLCEVAKESQSYTPEGDGAWIVKNSWGSAAETFPNKNSWGDNGYFYISYYDKSVRMPESYDFILGDEANEYDTAYAASYDFLQSETVYNLEKVGTASMANVFTAEFSESVDEGYQVVNINGMACNTSKPNTTVTYKLYLLNEGYTSPTDGTCAVTVTENYDYGGYHRVTFNPVMVSVGQKYSVVVTETAVDSTTNETKYIVPYNAASKVPSTKGYYSKSVVNKGESYLLRTDASGVTTVQDWADYIVSDEMVAEIGGREVFDQYAIDNLLLKAYGTPFTASPATVSSSGASFAMGAADTDAVLTFGEGLEGFSVDNFDAARGVTVDGVQLASNNYKVETGSIKLTLYKDYLNTLAVGSHTVRVYLKDSATLAGMPDYVESTLTVSEKASDPTVSAKTGDSTGLILAGVFAIVVLAGVGAGVGLQRRRRQ